MEKPVWRGGISRSTKSLIADLLNSQLMLAGFTVVVSFPNSSLIRPNTYSADHQGLWIGREFGAEHEILEL